MTKLTRALAVTGAALALSLAGAQAAGAVTLYQDNNYQNAFYSGGTTSSLGGNGDHASSVSASGGYTLYEDLNFGGRSTSLSGNYNSLSAVTYNLHWPETWNDRVDSLIG